MTRSSGSGLRKVIVNVRFSESQADILYRLAEEQEITVSSLVRRAISRYVFDELGGPTMEGRAPYRRSKPAA